MECVSIDTVRIRFIKMTSGKFPVTPCDNFVASCQSQHAADTSRPAAVQRNLHFSQELLFDSVNLFLFAKFHILPISIDL